MKAFLLSSALEEPLQRQDPCTSPLEHPAAPHTPWTLNKPLFLEQGKGNPLLSQIPLHNHLTNLVIY